MQLLADDMRFQYRGNGGCDSHCQMKIYGLDSDHLMLYLHDPKGNKGTTVTNSVAELASLVFRTVVPNLQLEAAAPDKFIVVTSSAHDSKPIFSLIDFVFIDFSQDVIYENPMWRYVGSTFDEAAATVQSNLTFLSTSMDSAVQ